jgi:hypothetical protein
MKTALKKYNVLLLFKANAASMGIATKIKDFKIVSILKKMNCCCVEFKDYFTVGDQNALKTEVFLTII